jgi:putative DNA primase/helicase
MNEDQPLYHLAHIRASVSLFLPADSVVELRALGADRMGTCSGYFDDRERLIEAACTLSGRAEGVYLTINPVNRELLARANNRARPFSRYTTGDDDVTARRWLVIDADPVRPRGISATDEEKALAHERAAQVRRFIAEHLGKQPAVVASSGNGCHLLYRYHTPNNAEARDALQSFLRVLVLRFNDTLAEIDPVMFNAARICRLYGTMAKKGDPTEDRPHRISRIDEVNRNAAEVMLTVENLRELSAILTGEAQSAARKLDIPPSIPLPPRPRRSGTDFAGLRIADYFAAHDAYGRCVNEERGQHAVLCPWENEHSSEPDAMDTDTTIWDGRDGRLPGFRCMHAHCSERRLNDVLTFWTDHQQFGTLQRRGTNYENTDDGTVTRVIDRYGEHIRYCRELGTWLVWAGRGKWEAAGNGCDVYEMIRDTYRHIQSEAMEIGDPEARTNLMGHVTKMQKWERMRAVYNGAAVRRDVQASIEQFDANPWLLNTPNAVIDLRTGEVMENKPLHYCSRQTAIPYNPGAVCPRFDQFLLEIFGNDETLVDFIWRIIGYSLTGSVREQVLFFLYGSGSNGKSTLLEVLRRLLGDYGSVSAPGLLIESKSDRHPTEIADLRGRRLVYCVETGEGKRLAEELVKRLTGSDLLKGRMMRQDFFSFLPTHKLWLSANHKPTIRGTDHAIWRRIPLIPFEVQFRDPDVAQPGEPVKDAELLDKLDDELSGILVKAIRAARDWYENGLPWPERVRQAVSEYRQEQDVLGTFIAERCEERTDAIETAADLYAAYRHWSEDAGEFTVSQRRFSLALGERGLEKVKSSSISYRGLRLLSNAEMVVKTDTPEPLLS